MERKVMETKKCVQCGKEFTLKDSEISFYTSKGLNLPKRGADCRKGNKKKAKNDNAQKNIPDVMVYNGKSKPAFKQRNSVDVHRTKIFRIVAIILVLVVALLSSVTIFGPDTQPSDTTTKADQSSKNQQATDYDFRNQDLFMEHFHKHGAETGSLSSDEYLTKANAVIDNKNALTKREADGDGDKVYFIETTGEIVFVSTDGYIRTYFIADKAYFERT